MKKRERYTKGINDLWKGDTVKTKSGLILTVSDISSGKTINKGRNWNTYTKNLTATDKNGKTYVFKNVSLYDVIEKVIPEPLTLSKETKAKIFESAVKDYKRHANAWRKENPTSNLYQSETMNKEAVGNALHYLKKAKKLKHALAYGLLVTQYETNSRVKVWVKDGDSLINAGCYLPDSLLAGYSKKHNAFTRGGGGYSKSLDVILSLAHAVGLSYCPQKYQEI